MTKFTDKEIADELARIRGNSTKKSPVRMEATTVCLHCGTALQVWQASDPANPICGTCIGD